ncbi:NERD domain-containing protein [Bacillus clarus]|uniref:NERD domain-containing protein n=1 Tax=Bacillus clarus TaxID=2338372 RepID=A0A090YWS1_9BACI|nr:nuclease-related domain-containing protein [Bacillus clarus]KFN03384.1 nuclease-related domain protein [Bacillus clarus]RFT62704.1 NERD domain-containing protein [Bacillus clarus]
MEYVLICVILALLAGVFVLFYKNKQLESENQQLEFEKTKAIETHQSEIAATITEHKEQQDTLKSMEKKKYNDLKVSAAREVENMRMMKNQLAVQHSKERSDMQEKHSNEIHMLQSLMTDLRAYSKNAEEINTHEILHYMKRGFIQQGLVFANELHIIPNVFIRNEKYRGGNKVNDNRIHHLVLCTTGIYVLETKEWKGQLIHGLTKENAGIYSFMIDEIGKYQQEVEKEETFDFITEGTSLTLKIENEGNPAYKVKKLSKVVNNYLKEINPAIIKEEVKPILYFGNEMSESGKEVIDLSNEKFPRLKNREELVTYFKNERLKGNVLYTAQELEEIREIIERMSLMTV